MQLKIVLSSKAIIICIISTLFAIYGGYFVFDSSFVAIDGNRYFTIADDALISMRYAWNLSHGVGLVWNEGERVEGMTNFLMTLYMSFLTAIFDKIVAVLAVQFSNIFYLLVTAYFFMKIAEQMTEKEEINNRNLVSVLAFVAPLTYYPFVYWSLRGMEISMLSAIISAAIYFGLKAKDELSVATGVLLGLAFLTRPDAAVVIAVILAFRIFSLIKAGKVSIISSELIIVGLFVLSIGVFRIIYYGNFFPNTYTLKMIGMGLFLRIENGIGYVTPLLDTMLTINILCLLVIIFRTKENYLLFATLPVMAVLYQIYIGGDAFGMWRQIVLYVPYLYLILFTELTRLVTYLINQWFLKVGLTKFRQITQSVIIIACSGLLLFLPNKGWYSQIIQPILQTGIAQADDKANINTAILLNQLLKPSASVAVFYAGAIPYFTGLKAIDMLGKSDKYIASLPPDISGAISWLGMKSVPGHNKYDLNYSIVQKKPTYIAGYVWGRQSVEDFVKQNYYAIPVATGPAGAFQTVLFLLKDSPDVYWERLVVRDEKK